MRKKRRALIVDGYNVLGAWRGDMRGRAMDDARDQLTEMLRDYAGFLGYPVTVVYDAWQSTRMARTVEKQGLFTVVFTQRGETADQRIERMVDDQAQAIALDQLEMRVATSDGVEQTVVMGRGAIRVSARELLNEMEQLRQAGRAQANAPVRPGKASVMEHLPEDVRQKLEKMRRGGN
ncbi:MAG: NYN domain-containing protein [Clostridia bacterium]